jgi:simple sugar transport system ATP-binding protein
MRVELQHITKVFGTLYANQDISMTFEGGRIYAILGENGAGKSTLMKILSGYQPPTSGQILIDGQPAYFETPADALAAGIGMLHQDPLDVPNLTVQENFVLGRRKGLTPNWAEARAQLAEQCARLGFHLEPYAYIDSLTIGERQQLEIVRLLSMGAKVIILDEPTTGIYAEQKATLFRSLRRLAADERLTIILVSHKLADVAALCDEVFVLRGGCLVGRRQMPTPISDLVALMFGQSIERPARAAVQTGPPILELENLSFPARRMNVQNLSLTVRAGEVIGLAGLDGSGQTDFLRVCAGLGRITGGRVRFDGMDIRRMDYPSLMRRGVAFAPAGRLEEGLVGGLTVAEHFALVMPGPAWVNWRAVRAQTEAQIAHYHIRGLPDSPIQTLSGGNQQRTLIALLPEDLRLLLLEEPTRGLDVESTRWVWQQLLARRAKGTTILFSSPDLDEIVEYSDRVAVFYAGHVTLVDHLDGLPNAAEYLGGLIGGKGIAV